MHAPAFLHDLLIILGLGVVVVLLFHRLRLPPIVGFLSTGVLIGPHGLGLIRDLRQVDDLAEIGVVLLLFTVGIEFSISQLVRLRTFLLGGGSLQVGLTLAATAIGAMVLGIDWRVAVFLGMLVALSSTAIVLRLLADRAEMNSPHGQATLGILIFQDLCLVPMVLLTPFLAGRGGDIGSALLVAAKAIGFVIAAVLAARYVVPWVLHQVVGTRKREVFLLTIIFICLGTAWATSMVGLSLALGAFIAGLVISESEYSHQALGEILPLREVFFSLFFVSIGMLFDVRTVLAAPHMVLGAILAVLTLKTVVAAGAAALFGHPARVALVAGLALAQIGEFSFVLSRSGLEAGLLSGPLYQLFLAVAVGTMMLTPALVALGPRIAARAERRLPRRFVAGRESGELAPQPTVLTDHVIVVGYGLNGRNLTRVLGRMEIPFSIVEMNPEVVRRERKRGREVLYGDATRPEVLHYAGIDRARVIVFAISDAAATRGGVYLARQLNPRIHIIVRSRYVHEMEALFALGTNEVVPEEFETSVEIFSRVLHRYLVPRDVIEQQIREIRRGGYEMLRSISVTTGPALGLQRFLSGLAMEVFRVEPGCELAGTMLVDSGLRDRSGVTVVAIHRTDGTIVANPRGVDVLHADDIALILGRHDQISRALPLFRAGGASPPDVAGGAGDTSASA